MLCSQCRLSACVPKQVRSLTPLPHSAPPPRSPLHSPTPAPSLTPSAPLVRRAAPSLTPAPPPHTSHRPLASAPRAGVYEDNARIRAQLDPVALLTSPLLRLNKRFALDPVADPAEDTRAGRRGRGRNAPPFPSNEKTNVAAMHIERAWRGLTARRVGYKTARRKYVEGGRWVAEGWLATMSVGVFL